MTDESGYRDRDEAARDRDDEARDRDDVARDEEADAQRAARTGRRITGWATIVLIVMVAGLFIAVAQRNNAIDDLRAAAARIEQAATHTEEVLVEVVEEQQTPESQAQAQRVREALEEIAIIRRLLCELPELADMPACNQ